MSTPPLRLFVLSQAFAICRLNPNETIPGWAYDGEVFSITRTADELSIVCEQINVLEGIQCEAGWRCLRVEGPLDFSLTGVLASLLVPLAEAAISIFSISTFDTDYLLVKEDRLARAIDVLSAHGHTISS